MWECEINAWGAFGKWDGWSKTSYGRKEERGWKISGEEWKRSKKRDKVRNVEKEWEKEEQQNLPFAPLPVLSQRHCDLSKVFCSFLTFSIISRLVIKFLALSKIFPTFPPLSNFFNYSHLSDVVLRSLPVCFVFSILFRFHVYFLDIKIINIPTSKSITSPFPPVFLLIFSYPTLIFPCFLLSFRFYSPIYTFFNFSRFFRFVLFFPEIFDYSSFHVAFRRLSQHLFILFDRFSPHLYASTFSNLFHKLIVPTLLFL